MRALNNEMDNERAEGQRYSLPGLNDIGRSGTPIFLWMDNFL